MPSLTEFPVELLLDNLLPVLRVRDLLSLGATNRFFAILCADDTFWKRKLEQDFNFSRSRTARTSGWKFIYKGLSKPKVFVWGESDNGRLGLLRPPKAKVGRVPFPVLLEVPGRRIIDIVAGGWSFHAIDSEGQVFVWGTLDGTLFALNSDGFAVSQKIAETPLRLELPNPVRSVSCARLYSIALDSDGNIWNFVSWGRPFRILSSLLDRSSPDSTPMQIECGWTFSVALTESGQVYAWWPFNDPIREQYNSRMEELDTQGGNEARPKDGAIPCITWDLPCELVRLPNLPRLPALGGVEGKRAEDEIKLIKIAAMDNHVIGLTNVGHVLKFNHLESATGVAEGRWTYLPLFSEADRVNSNEVFIASAGESAEVTAPVNVHITHISAHFHTFVAYTTGSESIILIGKDTTDEDTAAQIIPSLQYKSIISVVLGDYHYGALTSDGKLYTWGAFSNGALGLGDPMNIEPGQPGGFATEALRNMAATRRINRLADVTMPTQVRFDHQIKKKKDRFCFAAAAAGWHMGALVIDLEDDDEEEVMDAEPADPSENMPGAFHPLPQPPFTTHGPGEIPILPMARGGISPFRIGFAGRGAGPGGGAGRGTQQ
ncbi:RCC1/BLIP-II [Rickenella mellea]|uniref:RCC1/BLIP-II n=1 Tax=Rickenella mellea TaxID=50990 RepID=A0A4Y7Q9R8_9AGAM|nr:RCC1/BLIP-II [Rickenella mellea]